ncbi:hypothetical protein JCM5296_003579 [Sporobolomyces johnsonii]
MPPTVDFGDVVTQALAHHKARSPPLSPEPSPPPHEPPLLNGHPAPNRSSKQRPPPLDLVSPTSSGASPAARSPIAPSTPRTYSHNHNPPHSQPYGHVNSLAAYSMSDYPSQDTQRSTSHLGLDQPRPKHRSQASFDWFGEFRADGGFDARSESPGRGGAAAMRRTDSPASGNTLSPLPPATPKTPRRRAVRNGSGSGGGGGGLSSDRLTEEPQSSEWEDESAPREPRSALRGAFTAEDFDRGMRKIQSGDTGGPDEGGGGGRKGGKKLQDKQSKGGVGHRDPSERHPPESAASSVKKNRLFRPHSAGAAEGPGVSSSSDGEGATSTSAGRARSMHAGAEGDGDGAGAGAREAAAWEDEVRDQFDTNASSPTASRRPTVAGPAASGSGSRKGSLWTSRGNFRHRGGGESGASTPRDSDDEGATSPGPGAKRPPAQTRRGSAWGVVRSRLKGGEKKNKAKQGASLTGHELISELATGVLPLVLVKMAVMDRDERGDHRIPILMNYLKLRITDSVYPFHDRHAIFRIELEYGDGAVKWVIYRELKDFVNLHAHYRVANLRQGIDKFPTFPKTSLPYLNWLRTEGRGGGGKDGKDVGKAEFARAQREALENYLLKLIKATMFGPSANRLCKFLEISAMSIQLATRGGAQGKQGYLRITSGGAGSRKQPGFHPLKWKKRHDPKWFIVRDSYIVAVDDPASTEIYEVIMVDSTFEIERPTRIYRKGLGIFHHDSSSAETLDDPAAHERAVEGLLATEPHPQGHHGAGDPNDPSTTQHGRMNPTAQDHDESNDALLKDTSNHTFYLKSSERKLRLVAKTERQQDQFIASIEKMLARTIWAGRNRFDSFAPIRLNVAAQWLIDGRDYFWSLSRAIALAKHKIFIHDWWLSPELYLRRPPHENEKWRLDRLLQRKAREGVEIFVIVYKEVSNDFTPVDSQYTKTRLRALHPNIHIQRSPSHTSTGTLLWSHHEKMCVIDETIGFMGGIDLCFGRWDTPGHVLIDDGPNIVNSSDPQNADRDQAQHAQIWPGKDYANQRVLDFHTLTKPEDDMYDRGKVPRQPWHDIGLQIIGQPARDLCRHFIQRWNYLLRTKNHSVKMSFLVPAPDFTPKQLQDLRITGTCEAQICRSVGPWSMGISHVEHSIQTAYIKAIQLSDHFVYIENQFFITSTEVEGTVVENKIGDALVSRIVRAHSEGTPWRAIIVIPMVPGYPYPIDHSDASSVRLIMECQFRSICRGEHSIFARLRHEGIDPDEYISFFGLRTWGKLTSGALTTESTYIHAKGMIVDDRIAIIGSANINERSQRGDRDSELACIIRDTDMIDSTMGGKPYKVGRFAHTMRVRLMREHLGIDVDELEANEGREELLAREAERMQEQDEEWDPDREQSHGTNRGAVAGPKSALVRNAASKTKEYVGGITTGLGTAAQAGLEKGIGKLDVDLNIMEDDVKKKPRATQEEDEQTPADKIADGEQPSEGFASTVVPTLEEKMMAENRPKDHQLEETNGRVGKIRDQAQREREEGPTTKSAAQQRQVDNEDDDEQGGPGKQQSKANGMNGIDPKKTVQPLEGTENDNEPYVDADPEKTRGSPVTQHNPEADDTRKLVGNGSGKDSAPLSPISEGSHDGYAGGQYKANGDVKPSKPTNEALPSDVANADQGYRSMMDGHQGGDNKKPQRRNSSSASRGNESAANRNKITAQLRRNLRERGAYTIPLAAPQVDPHGFADPLVDSFYKDVWLAAAVRNTQIYRKVFRCMPDDLVQTWKQYREFQTWAERHNKPPKDVVPPDEPAPFSDPAHHQGQHGAGGGGSTGGVMGQGSDEPNQNDTIEKQNSRLSAANAVRDKLAAPSVAPAPAADDKDKDKERDKEKEKDDSSEKQGGSTFGRRVRSGTLMGSSSGGDEKDKSGGGGGRARSATLAGGDAHEHDEAFPKEEREQMEQLLEEVTGQLVVFPTRFLEAESANGNFLFSKDRIPPMAIYD